MIPRAKKVCGEIAKLCLTVIASAAKQSRSAHGAKLDCFVARAPRNDGKAQLRDLAECFFRELFVYSRPLRIEGAGNAGRPMRPIAVCAMVVVERTRAYRSHRNHPAFPTQWFTDYTVLSPVLGLFGHRHP